MKTMRFFGMMMAAAMMTAMPIATVNAVEADTTTVGMTVNGKPATPQQKAVALKMAKQSAKMGQQAAKLAVTAVTNPKKAEKIAKDLETMGEEMEKMGDSLETLSEDTTFFYEGEDSAGVVVTDEDFDELVNDINKGFGWLDSWWGRLIGGSFGILAAIIAILIAIVVVAIIFLVFTSPLWIIALIIWLLVRDNKKKAPHETITQKPTPNEPQGRGEQPNNGQASVVSQTAAYDERTETWNSGIKQCCLGAGLIILFLALGAEELWGIGAVIICLGAAKLIIVKTGKHNSDKQQYTRNDEYIKNADEIVDIDEYKKTEI